MENESRKNVQKSDNKSYNYIYPSKVSVVLIHICTLTKSYK